MKKLIIIILIALSYFPTYSQITQDTCVRKDWFESLQYSVRYLVYHDSLLSVEVGLLEDANNVLQNQMTLTSEQLVYEQTLRNNAEINFNKLKDITLSYQIATMKQSEQIKEMKKKRWVWAGSGALVTLVTFLIVK